MLKDNFYKIFILIMTLMICSRLIEIFISYKNERTLLMKFNLELYSVIEHKIVFLFHIIWFVALTFEALIRHSIASHNIAIICYLLLIASHILRMESIKSLQTFWTFKIYKIKREMIVSNGVIKYFAHPSYLAVIIEFIAVPLLFTCFYTFFIFSFANGLIIFNRIMIEKKLTGRLI